MADNLTDGLNELAQGFQKRFKVSNKLTIQDMIDLVTPPVSQPALHSGTEILGRTKASVESDYKSDDISLTLETVPPVMSKPIKLLITLSSNDLLSVFSTKLIFNKSDGTQLSLAIPDINTGFKNGEHWVKTVSVTIPANTSIANNKAILTIGEFSNFDTIEKIIATY